jgi:hypothetical protein
MTHLHSDLGSSHAAPASGSPFQATRPTSCSSTVPTIRPTEPGPVPGASAASRVGPPSLLRCRAPVGGTQWSTSSLGVKCGLASRCSQPERRRDTRVHVG